MGRSVPALAKRDIASNNSMTALQTTPLEICIIISACLPLGPHHVGSSCQESSKGNANIFKFNKINEM